MASGGSSQCSMLLLRFVLVMAATAAVVHQSGCAAARLPHKGWAAAPVTVARPASGELKLAKSADAVVDSAGGGGHAAIGDGANSKSHAAQTLLDELFSGTWGPFIIKDSHVDSSPTSEGSAELILAPSEHAPNDEYAAAADDDDDGVTVDASLQLEAKLQSDQIDEVDDHDTATTTAVIGTAADAVVDMRGTASDDSPVRTVAASGGGSGSGGGKKPSDHSGSVERHRGGAATGGASHPAKGRADAEQAVDSGAVRSHWRRGHDRVTTNRLTSAAEPADEAWQQPKQQRRRLVHNVVAYHLTEREPDVHDAEAPTEGAGGGVEQAHRQRGNAAEGVAAAPQRPPQSPNARLVKDRGRSNSDVRERGASEPTLPRGKPEPAASGKRRASEHGGRAAPKPGSGNGLLSDGRGDEMSSERQPPVGGGSGSSIERESGGIRGNSDGLVAAAGAVSEGGSRGRQQQRSDDGRDGRAKRPTHGGGHRKEVVEEEEEEEESSVGHWVLLLPSAMPSKQGARQSAAQQASRGSLRPAEHEEQEEEEEEGTAAGRLWQTSLPASRWLSRSSKARMARRQRERRPAAEQHGPAKASAKASAKAEEEEEDDGWAAGLRQTAVGGISDVKGGTRAVGAAVHTSEPSRVERAKHRSAKHEG